MLNSSTRGLTERGIWPNAVPPPRRLHRRCLYLTGRFARHAPRWELIIWARQLALQAIATCVEIMLTRQHQYHNSRGWVRGAGVALVFMVLTFTLRLQRQVRPFALRKQNILASVLYAVDLMLLILASIDMVLVDDLASMQTFWRDTLQWAMLLILTGGVLFALVSIRNDVRSLQTALQALDFHEVVSVADRLIDERLSERVEDSSVRLVKGSWLLSEAADHVLPRDPTTGVPIMCRCQELPSEAFYSPGDALAKLRRADRSVIALSHGWLTPMHPDPHGTTLASLRTYLRACGPPDAAIFIE